jgi:NTE family protein
MRGRIRLMALGVIALSLTVLVAGCRAHYPPTPVLTQPDSTRAYRFRNFPADSLNSDSIFVALVLSGGGTRAAAMSYGVMRELAGTKLPGVGASSRTMLDEVDVISSVSGGSFAGAYFAVNGWQAMPRFEREFLKWDAEGELKKRFIRNIFTGRIASRRFSRIDLAAELWSERLFDRRTFGDLVRARRRPFLIINASDMSAAEPFSFTSEQFAPMCGDLGRIEIGRAVAASSAFPGLLTPLTLENHAARCVFAADSIVLDMPRDPGFEIGTFDTERYHSARHFLSYDDTSRKYIHLLDGGLADNIGLRPMIRSLTSTAADFSLQLLIGSGRIRHVVFIVVNAKTQHDPEIERSPSPPGLVKVFQAVTGKPMGNYSRESIYRLHAAAHEMNEARSKSAHSGTPVLGVFPTVTAVEVSFDAIADSLTRHKYLNLPTSFRLPTATVDSLIAVGGCLLRESPKWIDFVRELKANRSTATGQPCTITGLPPRPER